MAVFVFYDTETTGLIRDFDQVLQFAAILTDDGLNEVERFNIRCRCRPWTVPSPVALKITGVKPAQLGDPSLPSFYEMMGAIRAKLEQWSPARFVGYNTIRFDEPRLQRAFWETLNPPYLTVMIGNARLDILPIVQTASHLYPNVLAYPLTERGKTGFKLDVLAPLNGFAHARAHDALADVEATIHIARIVAERLPSLWKTCVEAAPKAATVALLSAAEPFLIVEHFANGPSVWWGQRIDAEGARGTSGIVARLGTDWSALVPASYAQLGAALSVSPKPLRKIGLNKAPILFSTSAAKTEWGLAPTDLEIRQSQLFSGDAGFRERLVRIQEELEPARADAVHLEQMIHAGFASRADETRMARFHQLDWAGRAGLVREFEDARFRQLAQRLVFEAAPEMLPPEDRERLRQAIAKRLWTDHEDKELWRSLPAARLEIDEIRKDDSGEALAGEFEALFAAFEARFPAIDIGNALPGDAE